MFFFPGLVSVVSDDVPAEGLARGEARSAGSAGVDFAVAGLWP